MTEIEERPLLEPPGMEAVAEDEAQIYDENGAIKPEFLQDVTSAIEAGDAQKVRARAGRLHEADLGLLTASLEPELRPKLVEMMGAAFDFAALTEMDDNIREEILAELPNETVAEGVRDLESDDAVSILADLEPEDQAEILEALPPADRVQLERSLEYHELSAGRLMQTSFVTAPPFWTAGQAINVIRDASEENLPESFFEIFVVDPAHRLLGNVFLDTLLRAKSAVKLEDIMSTDRRRVAVTEERDEVARIFQRYNLVSVPVVDEADRLVGVITIDDIVDVIREEADAEVKALGGVSEAEELSDTVWWTAKSRFLWLFVNLVTAFIASSVLGLFEGSLQKNGGACRACADCRKSGRQCGDSNDDGRRPRIGDARTLPRQYCPRDPARGSGRRRERGCFRLHHRNGGGNLVRSSKRWRRHRDSNVDQSHRRCPWRHSDPAGAASP
jgi:magnesium transporter